MPISIPNVIRDTHAKYNLKFSSSKKHAKWCGVPLKCSAGVSDECVAPPHVAVVAVVGEGGLHDHEGGELADLDQGLLKIVSSEAKRVRELWRGGTFAIKHDEQVGQIKTGRRFLRIYKFYMSVFVFSP